MEKMKIFMVGGRRCGKSTVLASMYNNASNTLMGTKLSLTASQKQMFSLQDTLNESESYFFDVDTESFVTVNDSTQTPEKRPYHFQLTLAGNMTGMEVVFTDVPGEFFTSAAHFEEVQEEIKTSHAIIIAIDTPSLMEDKIEGKGFGSRHDAANKVVEISKFIRESLDVESIRDRLIMFVPIKCEKYYFAGRMAEVAQAVQEGYCDLLTFFSNDRLKNSCTVAILPMISLGGLRFFRFTNDSPSPTASQEYIYHDNTTEGPKYVPLYCDQPLIYTTAYLMRMYQQSQKGLINKVKAVFSRIFSVFSGQDGKELEKEFDKLAAKRIHDQEKGFVTIQDPLQL